MSNIEHLIENAIYALIRGEDLREDCNTEYTHCTLEEAKEIAFYVVHTLYDGVLPDDDRTKK